MNPTGENGLCLVISVWEAIENKALVCARI